MALGFGTTKFGTADSGLQIARHTGNIAFSGTEDLGGGLRAGFRLETSIGMIATTNQTAPAATAPANNSGNTTLGDRGAAMTLSGGFGTATIGRAPTSVRALWGSIGDVSRLQAMTTMSAGSNSNPGNLTAGTGDAIARIIVGDAYANQVSWTSPSMSGFQIGVGMVPVQAADTGSGNNTVNKDTYSAFLIYSQGPISAAYNLTDTKGGSTPKQAAHSFC